MFARVLLVVGVLGLVSRVSAQACPADDACVDKADMQAFIQLAGEQKCRSEQAPTVTADPVTIIVDREGRVYGSGTGDKPFHLRLQWCNYSIDATSQIKLQTAQRVEPEWGFRFRPKAAFGVLTRDLLTGHKVIDSGDVGLMIEPFFYHWVNVNGFISFRSVGIGLGADLTTNFGVALLFNTTWDGGRANPFVATYFAF